MPEAQVETVEEILSGLEKRWHELKESIPCVPSRLDGVVAVILWGSEKGRTSMEQQAAAFLSYVWWGEQPTSKSERHGLPLFDAFEVAGRADEQFRRVVADWITNPFWP